MTIFQEPQTSVENTNDLGPSFDARTPSVRTNRLMGVSIEGVGSYLPEHIVTNAKLNQDFGFDPEWIERRTGILERRHAAPDQATSHLCVEAGKRAMADAGVDPSEVDLLILGTFTPDFKLPSTANIVQERLGIDAPAMEMHAGCSVFMYGLITAAQYLATGNANCALVIGGDCGSRATDPTDRKIAPILSDGAGAAIVRRGTKNQGFVSYQLGSDGKGEDLIWQNGGSSIDKPIGGQYIQMDGKKVFKWAVQHLARTIRLILSRSDLTVDDVDLVVLHQANMRIIDAILNELNIPKEKSFSNLQKYGNTSAGTIPIVLDEAKRVGRIQPGSNVLMCGFGAGLSWCASLYRW